MFISARCFRWLCVYGVSYTDRFALSRVARALDCAVVALVGIQALRRVRDLVLWYVFVFVVLPALFYFANVLGALFTRLWGW